MSQIEVTSNYDEIDLAFERGNRGIVLPGGTRSSKTVSALQWIVIYCLTNTGKEIAICRDKMSNLKKTTLKDFEAICLGFGEYEVALYPDVKINKSDWTASINGNNISFFGLNDDPMRVYGFGSDIFYINEMISTYKNTFDHLEQRCRGFWIGDCNPSEPNSWVYKLEQRPDVHFYRSTYLDNPFLTKQIIDKIESYEPNDLNIKQGTADERKWSIYGRGEVFKGKEIIFGDWDNFEDDPEDYDYMFYGLDWGWNDPFVTVKLWINGKDLFVKEIIYGSEIEWTDIITTLKAEQPLRDQTTYLVCDYSEGRSIRDLQKEGIPAHKCKKGQGSVLQGIRKMQAMDIHVHKDSQNIMNEFNNYKFKTDPKTDTLLDIPVDRDNHACDAIRYPILTFL
tara:strand:+ start:3638 stop:4822 length:1185 start_codon:yes stop_codon:yes gene_type:complete